MAVYYRYRSGVDTFSLPVSAPSISVGELKRLIMGTSRHGHGRTRGRGPREGIAISDAHTGTEYADESAPVLRNSTVVVRRVAGPPAGTIVASSSPQRPKASQDRGDASSSSDSLSSSGLSASEEDGVERVLEAVAEPARSGHHGRAPHAGYVCRRCRVPGHFIQHCPTNGDPRFNFGPPAPEAPAADNDDDDGVPADLHCKICTKVMADAVMSSKCCFSSFCDRCIRAHIVDNSRCACGAPARADDLVPNPALRTTVSNILAARASNASKQRSSDVGRDVAATSAPQIQSPAASESRRSQVSSKKSAATESEHGGVSGSMSAPRAAREPRKEQETTGTAEARPNHADHHRFGYSGPFAPACYFGGNGMPWSADPSMYCYGYGGAMPHAYGGGYPMGPHHVDAMGNMTVPPAPRHGGESYGYRGRKRTGADCEDRSFKRRCGGGRSQVALVLT